MKLYVWSYLQSFAYDYYGKGGFAQAIAESKERAIELIVESAVQHKDLGKWYNQYLPKELAEREPEIYELNGEMSWWKTGEENEEDLWEKFYGEKP